MPEPIYFQWQNAYLQRTIYPLREMKLRDFLVYFYEIAIWKKYKDVPIQSLAGEVQAYRAAQKARVLEAFERYQELEAYLMVEDVTQMYRVSFPGLDLDAEILKQINEVHKAFKRYFPNYKNPVKEKYFASDRVRQMEGLLKQVEFRISEQQRIMRNNGPAWLGRPKYEKEMQRLSTVSKVMVEKELRLLVAFLSAYERLFQFKADAMKQKAARERDLQTGSKKLQDLRGAVDTQQARLGAVQGRLRRLRTTPDAAALKAYFFDDDVTDVYRRKVGEPDPAVLRVINEAHRAFKSFFPTYNDAVKEKYFIGQRLNDIDRLRKLKQQELATAARLGNVVKTTALKKSLQVLDEELERLTDFQWLYEIRGKPPGFAAAEIAKAEQEQRAAQDALRAAQASIQAQEKALDQFKSVMAASDKDLILAFIDAAPVTVNDLARSKVEEYKNSLIEKDHQQLLELVVQEFMRSPTRYPLWLQYMVVHFSGMRYQSAHGSWADPKDMLLALRMRAIEKRLRAMSSEAIQVLCEQRYQIYKSGGSATIPETGEAARVPALATTKDESWRRRVEYHTKALDPASWYNKYRALLDVEIDEEDYDIQHLPDAQALTQLEDVKDEMPDWMWTEIVRSTNLRLTHIQKENWEQVTQEELDQRYASGMGPYRDIMLKWKRENLTGWREEHDRTSQLIVSRAVCNEVAEHIQHIRGRTPPGGLTAKPEWYKRLEKDPRLARVPDKPGFVKPKTAADFRPGASIFWLRWVNKEPNIWQITRPFAMGSGEELIPAARDAQNVITNTGSAFLRESRFNERQPNGQVIERQSKQWLRWNHEATVVEVAETADGPSVLTFETAMPGEDRRQSTIGVFKRYVSDLKYNVSASLMNGVFVGYIPEGAVPYQNLREMLDWNRVLLRNAYTPAQIEQYWKQVQKPVDPSIAFGAGIHYPDSEMETAPKLRLRNHREQILCYELESTSGCMGLYQPAVEIPRGVRLLVSKLQGETVDGETYYPVTHCDFEPRAEGLFTRALDLNAVPDGPSLRKARARKAAAVYRLLGADDQMQPVFEESGLWLKSGTRFLVSTVHKVGPRDTGDGVIHGQGRQGYYLILACPDNPAVEGLFMRRGEQRALV